MPPASWRCGIFIIPTGAPRPGDVLHANKAQRLVVVLAGEKIERMGFDGKAVPVTLHAGDFYFLDSGIWEECNFSTVHELLCVVLLPSFLRTVWYPIRTPHRSGDPWPEHVAMHIGQTPESLRKAFSVLAEKELDDNDSAAKAAARLILELTVGQLEHGVAPSDSGRKLFEQMRSFVEIHFSGGLTRKNLAVHFHRSESYVSALFRKHTGKSFYAFLDECRIRAAKKLLRDTSLPLKEIAQRCGYSDYVYFVRRFRELVKTPPGHYRLTG
ncbi:MAG: AraC family transcriptional regulator [Victivallaceae bacterium]|nr:AraC family transcriptional regulator [Victivallaceae bacterium]